MSISTSTIVDNCIVSGKPVTKILDFGQHSYADTFIAKSQLNLSEPVFPLQVMLNPDSGSIQLGYVSNDEERYTTYSYSYTSSNSKTSRDHWDEFANSVKASLPEIKVAVEIGSNDGYLISQFLNTNTKVIGVDPSREMCELAEQKGVQTMPVLFNSSVAQEILNKVGKVDVVMANNVFNHANDPVEFSRAVATILQPTGFFVFEVPYWLCMIESGRFTDMVYHEHPAYYTIKMLFNVLKAAGLEISKYEIVDYHGGSLRVYAKTSNNILLSEEVEKAIVKETESKLFDPSFYTSLQRKFEKQRDEWLYNFYSIRDQNPDATFIGVGAAAKANTWLTWHGLNKTHLHCITDSSPLKQNKFTPLTRIPIKGDEVFSNFSTPYAIILSWNIGKGLRDALLRINANVKFLSQ